MIKGKIAYIDQALRDLQASGELAGQDTTRLAKQVYSMVEGAMAAARIQNDLDMLRGLYEVVLKVLGIQRPLVAT